MTGLDEGAQAPDFELRDQHGRSVTLSRLRGRSAVALVFFPAVFSSVCSSELSDLRDWWADPVRRPADAALLAISCDPMFSLRGYSDAADIDYPLLSDFWPHGAVAQRYDVFDDSVGTARRSSYVVDTEGRVAWSVHHAARVARAVTDLEQALAAIRA